MTMIYRIDQIGPMVKQMFTSLTEIANQLETKKFLFDVGSDVRLSTSPEDMTRTLGDEYEKWRGIVEAAKIPKE